MGAGAGAQKITTDVTGNDTAGMVAGMVASGMTAKGLNGIEAEANKLAKAPKGIDGVTEGAGNLAEDVGKAGKGLEGATKGAESAAEDAGKVVESGKTSPKGLIGHDFEDYLTKNIGGDGSFSVGGRDFDGGIGNRWWEAKSGNYWNMLESNPNKLAKFKSDMGARLRIATENGATYELFSNTPIPNSIKQWLDKKGIAYTELLN